MSVIGLFPKSVLAKWLKVLDEMTPIWRNIFLFHIASDEIQNYTYDLDRFRRQTESLIDVQITDALNRESYPRVKCFCGAGEFIEKTGRISLKHFINYYDPSFTAFKANAGEKLAPICPNFLKSSEKLDEFVIAPGIEESLSDLNFLTCAEHNGGSKLKTVHPLRHPFLGNISPRMKERLSPVTLQTRTVKTGKVGHNSHCSQLLNFTTNFGGGSCSLLTEKSDWGIVSDNLYSAERLAYQYRSDVKSFINQIFDAGKIDNVFIQDLQRPYDNFENSAIQLAAENSTYVKQCDSVNIRKMLNERPDEIYQAKNFPGVIYNHPVDGFGSRPKAIFKFWKNSFLRALQAIFFNDSALFRMLKTSEDMLPNLCLDFLFNLMSKKNNMQAARRYATVIETYIETNNCTHLQNSLQGLFEKLKNIQVVTCEEQICLKNVQIEKGKKYLILIKSHCETNRRSRNSATFNSLPEEFDISEYTLSLTCAAFLQKKKPQYYVRHGGLHKNWWFYEAERGHALPLASFNSKEETQRVVICAIYAISNTSEDCSPLKSHMELAGGQGTVKCGEHSQFLIQARNDSLSVCTHLKSCKRKGKYICTQVDCNSSICKKCFQNYVLNNSEQLTLVPKKPKQKEQLHMEDDWDIGNDLNVESENENECDHYLTDSGPVDYEFDPTIQNIESGLELSDSGVQPLEISIDIPKNSIPLHVLFNNYMFVLKRKKLPIYDINNHKNFFQRLVSKNEGQSVPLVYPDATLLPSLFWIQLKDGSYPGSIPACFMTDSKFNRHIGFESVEKLIKTRMKMLDSQLSSNLSHSCFVFDLLMNQRMNTEHSLKVFRRGWDEQLEDLSSIRTPDVNLKFDATDSRRNVQALSSAIAEKEPTYFLTSTCNMAEHFGVAPIFNALRESYKDKSPEDYQAAIEGEMPVLVRAWERAATILMKWIEKSPQKPLGDVERIWYRFEFQTTKSNLPHIHCLIWLKDGEQLETTLGRIHSTESQCMNALSTYPVFGKSALLKTQTDIRETMQKIKNFHYHDCEKQNFRCHKKTKGDSESKCRYPKYPNSSEYKFEEVHVKHSQDCYNVLGKLGLTEKRAGFYGEHSTQKHFPAGQWLYPSWSSEHMSPINVHVFAMTKSQMNLLKCDRYISSRYIAKYAAGIEEKAKLDIYAGKNFDELRATMHDIQNEKISSVKNRVQIEQTKKKNVLQSRLICMTECYWILFDLPYVRSNFSITSVSTLPKEMRMGNARKMNRNVTGGGENMLGINYLETMKRRFKLPKWRFMCLPAKEVVQSALEDSTQFDTGSIYDARPPELYFVNSMPLYYKCFTRQKISGKRTEKLSLYRKKAKDPIFWVDGFEYRVYLRLSALTEVSELAEKSQTADAQAFLELVTHGSPCIDEKSLDTVVVLSCVHPENSANFLIHLILSFGKFRTERELFQAGTLLNSFENCGVFANFDCSASRCIYLTKKYVLEQAQFLPGSTRQFDKNVVQCYNLLESFFQRKEILYDATPSVLISDIKSGAENKLKVFSNVMRSNFLNAVLNRYSCLNSIDRQTLLDGTCDQGEILANLNAIMQNTLVGRQKEVFDALRNGLLKYSRGTCRHALVYAVLGRPGTGKSTLTQFVGFLGLVEGLNVIVTSLSAEKSASLGGIHLHRLFCIQPAVEKMNPMHIAENAIFKLIKDPVKLSFLIRLDVLIVEEVGMISAELLGAVNLMLQFLKTSPIPFGGVLILSNGDPKQLPPIKGTMLWASTTILTTFNSFYLFDYIRMKDKDGQRVLELLDSGTIVENDIEEIINIISASGNCKFVDSWDKITDQTQIKVFGTRAAEIQAANRDSQLVVRSGKSHIMSKSVDEISLHGHHNWKHTGDKTVSKFLDRECLEPDTLCIHDQAYFKITVNDSKLGVYQGQLCRIVDFDQKVISVILAAPGSRTMTCDQDTEKSPVKLRKRVGLTKVFTKQLSARRTQFPLKPFTASTIHKVIGDDVQSLATEISLTGQNKCWLREQVLVLLSRVSYLSNLTFVGPEPTTLSTLRILLRKETSWSTYVEAFLGALKGNINQYKSISITNHPIPPKFLEVPLSAGSCVYLLMSMPAGMFYVGQTNNMKRRLREHNQGEGSLFTKLAERRPWALIAAIYGFCCDDQIALNSTEWFWQNENSKINISNSEASLRIDNGQIACEKFCRPDLPLKLVIFTKV